MRVQNSNVINFFVKSRVLMFFMLFLGACGENIESKLVHAAGTGNLEEVKRLSEKVTTFDYYGYDGLTPLTAAAMNKRWDVVVYLVENGADVELSQRGGLNAIQWARKHNKQDIEMALIKKASD